MALSAYDQSIYDAGYKYIPQSQYLLDPFKIPTTQAAAPTISGGLTTIPVSMGGGDGGFNPYNLNTGQIRTDFDPTAYNLAMRQGETVGPNPDLFYAPQSKLGGLMDFIPGIGTIRRGAEFLKGMMPINERAIMENEARGMGVFTDDIGRIVGDPNTAQGIMAGYNLSKIDKGTFDKRRAAIEKGLRQTDSEEADRRLSMALTVDSGIGVVRHAQAGYETAKDVANGKGKYTTDSIKIPLWWRPANEVTFGPEGMYR